MVSIFLDGILAMVRQACYYATSLASRPRQMDCAVREASPGAKKT
jgi:hypothetical protein